MVRRAYSIPNDIFNDFLYLYYFTYHYHAAAERVDSSKVNPTHKNRDKTYISATLKSLSAERLELFQRLSASIADHHTHMMHVGISVDARKTFDIAVRQMMRHQGRTELRPHRATPRTKFVPEGDRISGSAECQAQRSTTKRLNLLVQPDIGWEIPNAHVIVNTIEETHKRKKKLTKKRSTPRRSKNFRNVDCQPQERGSAATAPSAEHSTRVQSYLEPQPSTSSADRPAGETIRFVDATQLNRYTSTSSDEHEASVYEKRRREQPSQGNANQ